MPELNTRGLEICRQATAAFKRKGNLDSFWQSTADNFYPERADFTTDKTLGEDFASSVYSSEPIIFRRDFANYLGAVLRPKGREWFTPTAEDDVINELASVRAYLEPRGKTTRRLLYNRKSQFIRAMNQADNDYVAFGNSVTSVEDRIDQKGFIFRTWHLRDCAWRENADGEVDTMFRRLKMSVRNLCTKERTRKWKLADKVKEKAELHPDDEISVLHVCMPIWDYDYTQKKYRFDWVSAYIDEDNKWEMSKKEVPEFDYCVSRWFTVAGSPYAFSPCVVCSIPDARTLQVMTWSILEAGEKAVEPPMMGMAEAILGGVDIRAGAMTWIDQRYDERTGEALRAIELGGSPEFGEALRQGITGNLNAAWYLNKLSMPQDNKQRTAEEIARMHEEFLRVAQPVIEPAEPERNGLVVDLVIQKSIRMGLWGKLELVPKELRGREIGLTYDNPIEDARRQSRTNSYRQVLAINRETVESGDTTSPAQFDKAKAYREAILGVAPPDWLYSEDDSEEKIKDAEEQETVSGAAAEVGAMAETAAKLQPKGAQAAPPNPMAMAA